MSNGGLARFQDKILLKLNPIRLLPMIAANQYFMSKQQL
jgi:hypothetical protein